MKTPAGPADPSPTLYGCVAPGINRRLVVTGGLLLPFAARAKSTNDAATRVKALNWTGNAQIFSGDKTIEIAVKTRVEPFLRARSQSWLAGKPETARTMFIGPGEGWVERGTTRTSLPARQAEHERQQFGLYGYMLLGLDDMNKDVRNRRYTHEGLPPIEFHFGDGLGSADYTVLTPEGEGTISQKFLFEGEYPDQGVHWPQTITIFQNDKPYFILDIETFTVELA